MQRTGPGVCISPAPWAKPSLPTVVAADSLAVLTSLQASMRDIRSQLPTGRGAPARLGRQLDAQAAALGARAGTCCRAQRRPSRRRARAAPVPVDPAGLRATLSWLANLLRRAVDALALDPASKAVVVRALGQIELASFDAEPALA
jgi:hypothetical protein